MAEYVDIPHQVLNTIQTAFGSSVFHSYFVGDPWLLAKSSLPALIVTETDDDTIQDATGLDLVTHTIVVKIVFDKRDSFNASWNTDVTEETIRQLVDKRTDLSDGQGNIASTYDPKTIKGVLRANFTIGGEVTNQTMKTKYYVERRPNELTTQEGRITFVINELVIVANRS